MKNEKLTEQQAVELIMKQLNPTTNEEMESLLQSLQDKFTAIQRKNMPTEEEIRKQKEKELRESIFRSQPECENCPCCHTAPEPFVFFCDYWLEPIFRHPKCKRKKNLEDMRPYEQSVEKLRRVLSLFLSRSENHKNEIITNNMIAKMLIQLGYGNIKQEIQDFLDKVKNIYKDGAVKFSDLENLFNELYGAEEQQ